jgi:DNA (cytosine-5)-methyltransferase 1
MMSLCSGYEGIGLGLKDVFDAELAYVADIDPGACKILKHRFPGVPNLGDLTKVNWEAVMPGEPPVDILTAGFP